MANINFNTKHLKKGDPLPPHTGKLRIYNMRFCPYAQRTILALNAKQIDYEVINVNLADKPDWLITKNPYEKVPILEKDEGVTVYESAVTLEYLDDIYPERPLLAKDPLQKAYDKIIVEAMAPVTTAFIKGVYGRVGAVTENVLNSYNKALRFIESHLITRGTKFLGGDQPGYADYMMWPFFERILSLQDIFTLIKIDPDNYQVLMTYFENMKEDPAVRPYAVSTDIIFKILETYAIPGSVLNYDILLEP